MTKEQLYEAALRAVVAQLGQLAPADFKVVGKEKCAEAAFYAAENALMGHNIDGTKATVEPQVAQCTALGGHNWEPAEQGHEFCAICQSYRRVVNREVPR